MSGAGSMIPLADENEVVALAKSLCPHLVSPFVFYLEGDLGAGKTTFARALIQSLGYPGRVKSPTYGLLESYQAAGFHILHLDLYRLESSGELDFLGLRDLFDNESILLVEWPGRGAGFLPPADVLMKFGEQGDRRFVELIGLTEAGQLLTNKFS